MFLKIKRQKRKDGLIEALECVDGFALSVQATSNHNCTAVKNNEEFYTHVEVGYPSKIEEILSPYESHENSHVFYNVPVNIIHHLIKKHQGLIKPIVEIYESIPKARP